LCKLILYTPERDLYKIPSLRGREMEFSPETWASHRKGRGTRAKILAALAENPDLSIAELSAQIGKCDRQIRRQLSTLVSEGVIRKEKNRYIFLESVQIA
jgi:predicted HTH transcriptional regulator